ncbi:MAG: alpha-ketoglutarate-dependent dioxygenase AlkB [Pseudoxanthomonas sp.]
MDLFPEPMLQLVEDAQGGIRYWPGFIDEAMAESWFNQLQARAAWTRIKRPMYDRVVDVPRLLAMYRAESLPGDLPLAKMLASVVVHLPAPYQSVGLNLYRDGNDSVAMHGDKLHSLTNAYPIALVSLGAPRKMLIRARAGTRDTLAIDLQPGSLLSMSHASQSTHEHGIPKTRTATGARISAVFRVNIRAE